MIPRQPVIIQPVPKLVLKIAPGVLSFLIPQLTGIISAFRSQHGTDLPLKHFPKSFSFRQMIAPAETRDQCKVLRLRFFCRFDHPPEAGPVFPKWLLTEYMLSGIDRGFQMGRTES